MTTMNHWGFGLVCAALVLGCSAGPGTSGEGTATALQLQLTTTGASGSEYRLGPASFVITGFDQNGPTTQTVQASGEEGELEVAVPSGAYSVTLSPDWVLQKVRDGGALAPVAATLLSPAEQRVSVDEFQVTPVNYAFHLGASGLDIGISVDEGVPDGFDGTIAPTGDGRFSINFKNGGGACCWATVDDARAAYPNLALLATP